MFNLIMAIVSSAMVSITIRIGESRCKATMAMFGVNYLVCLVIAGAYMGYGNAFPSIDGVVPAMGMGFINGCIYLLGFVLLKFNIQKNGVVLTTTFMKLGLLVPMAISILFFGEMPATAQLIGFAIAVFAIILINYEKEQTAAKFKVGLILILLSGGIGDSMAKIFDELGNPLLADQFLFYTFIAALILCIGLIIYKKEKIGKNEVLYGILVSIPNYFSVRFLLKSLETLDAVLVYPTYSVGAILLVTAVGVLCFKEKLSKKQKIAIGFILVALVFLNI